MDTAPCVARIDATHHDVAVQTTISAARVLLVAERVRIPVEPVELVQPMDRHYRLEAPHVRPAVELAADVGLAHSVGIERLDVQAARMPQRLHRNVESGKARRHLRPVTADADQMQLNPMVQ